jgi:hypothetical protein
MLRTQISHPLGLSPSVECLKPARIKQSSQSKTLFDQVSNLDLDLSESLANLLFRGLRAWHFRFIFLSN